MRNLLCNFDAALSAVVEPSLTVRPIPDFPEAGISTYSAELIEAFAQKTGAEQVAELLSVNGSLPVYRAVYKSVPMVFFLSRVGAPASVGGLEEVIQMGLRKLVLFGECGVLDSEIAPGEIIVPTRAVRDEGTSAHYAPPSFAVDIDGAEAVARTLDRLNCRYQKGITWTTDAIYRETRERMERRRKQGCIAVEMECSAMAAAAHFRGIKFAQFLCTADNLDAPEWEPRGLGSLLLEGKERYMDLACECVLEL